MSMHFTTTARTPVWPIYNIYIYIYMGTGGLRRPSFFIYQASREDSEQEINPPFLLISN